ncbi:MAG: DUF1549 domain-containing protein, partial [Verrucomicrobiota bacterium]
MRFAPIPLRLIVISLSVVSAVVCPAQAAKLSFNRDIRPILSENCFQCHGPDKDKREADLRLDQRDAAIEALAIAPGDPGKSDMIKRVFSTDADEQMPPADSNRKLTTAQKELLKRWVQEGAEYQPHWAFVNPTRPEVPAVGNAGAKQAKAGAKEGTNPVDAFIGATLAREGLTPAAEADRRTLIRRLSFDLTGLPPTPRDVEAFVASRDPRAYEKLVQQYLASPHYGERMAVPWLDLVRYADTIGFH